MRCGKLWLSAALSLSAVTAQENSAYTFGTTVVDSSGFEGRVFNLPPNTRKLPKFANLTPVGSVYTNSLNVWPQNFAVGFPNISGRDLPGERWRIFDMKEFRPPADTALWVKGKISAIQCQTIPQRLTRSIR